MATLSSVLAQIRQHESGGNYTAQNPTSTASGAYQFVNGTWQAETQASGIGTQYPTAASAPPNIQDAVAAYAATHGDPNSTSLWHASDITYPAITSIDETPQQYAVGGSGVSGSNTDLTTQYTIDPYTGNPSLNPNPGITPQTIPQIVPGVGTPGGVGSTSLDWAPGIWSILERTLIVVGGMGLVFVAVSALLYQSKTVQVTARNLAGVIPA